MAAVRLGEHDRTMLAERGTPALLGHHLDPSYELYPHIRLLSQKAVEVIHGETKRLLVSLPPQHGKSDLFARRLPLWLLDWNPKKRVVIGSYSADLAHGHGRWIRNTIVGNPDKLRVRLAPDSRAANRWNTPQGGGLLASGVGGAMTGFGADLACLTGEMMVSTPLGLRRIDAINPGDIVVAYDHSTGQIVERRVTRATASIRADLVDVILGSGRRVRCTSDHPIYVEGRGYAEAGLVECGEQVSTLGRDGLPGVSVDIPEAGLRLRQEPPSWRHRVLLRARLSSHRSVRSTASTLRGLRRPYGGEAPPALSRLPRGSSGHDEAGMVGGADRDGVPVVRGGLPSSQQPPAVLRPGLREQGARRSDDGLGQLALVAVYGLLAAVQAHAPLRHRPRRSRLHRVQLDGREGIVRPGASGGASLQRGPDGQPPREPRDAVPAVPHEAPRTGSDTVAMVRRVRSQGELVYDLTVDDAHNFFAEGVLVHNCIDDPFGSWEEAQSPVIREAVFRWFQTVVRTRLQKGGAIVVIQTRWHPEDLVGRLLADDAEGIGEGWVHVKLPAIADHDPDNGETDPLGRKPGEVLCEALHPLEEMRSAIRSATPLLASGLYQQHPSMPEGNMFPLAGWLEDDVPDRRSLLGVVRRWDLAATEGGGDYTAGTLLGRHRDGRTFVLDVVRVQRSAARVKELIHATALWDREKFGRRVAIRLEQEPGAAGKSLADEYLENVLGDFPGTIAIPSTGSKITRAMSWASCVCDNQAVIAPVRDTWSVNDFISEHAEFPVGRHDDQVDSAAGAYVDLRLVCKYSKGIRMVRSSHRELVEDVG